MAPEERSTALAMHRAGRLAEAAELYRRLLAENPADVEAWHLLGIVEQQRGDHAAAIRLIGKAVALRPSDAAFHANLGEAYRAAGDLARAIGCCRTALTLAPDFPEALANLGLALQAEKHFAEAEEEFRRALAVSDDFAPAHNNLGRLLRETGRREEAAVHFRLAIKCDPEFAAAHTNLGQLLIECGQAEEALRHCQEAARLQPDAAAIHHNLGNALQAASRPLDARAAYLESLRLDPGLAASQAQLGRLLWQDGELHQAIVWLEQATRLAPDVVSHWSDLAQLYDELERFSASAICWRRAIELSPSMATAHVSLGWALQEDGQLAAAEEHYRRALELKPDLGRAHVSLGDLQMELGDMAAAETMFREALRVSPNFAIPHARLATLLRGDLSAADQQSLETRLADRNLAPAYRSQLLFGLGHVLDARGEYARAAILLAEANDILLNLAPKSRRYAPAEHERFVNRLIEVMDRPFFARLTRGGLDSERSVFIVGLPRSGTTLLEQILAGHSQVFAAGELRLARRTFESIPGILESTASPVAAAADLNRAAALQLATAHFEQLQAAAPTAAPRIVDKMPDNYLYLGLLAVLLPRSTFIEVRRDVRDVALSCWMTDFRSVRWANHVDHITHRIRQHSRLMQHWDSVLPVTLHRVNYEDLVNNLEATARRLVAACGLQWEPECLAPHRVERPIRTASVTQVRQPVHARSVGRWRHYAGPLRALFAQLDDLS